MSSNCFLLLGPERGKRNDFIKRIISALRAKYGDKPEIYRYYPFELNIDEVISLLENAMLFSGSKVVIIHNVEEIKDKKTLDKIVAYCKHPNEDSVLILISDSMNVSQLIRNSFPKENVKLFWEMFESDKRGWIVSFFKKRGIEIDSGAVTVLLELVENNTADLKSECEKLALFFSARGRINEENIEEYLYHSKEENIFTLFNELAGRNLEGTLEVLYKIILSRKSGGADQIIMGILWQIERLYRLLLMLKDNRDLDEAFKLEDIRTARGKKVYGMAVKKYTLAEVERILQVLHETEVNLRTSPGAMHWLILELFFYRAIKKGI